MPLSINENLPTQTSDLFPYTDDIQFLQNSAPRSATYYHKPDYLQASFCHTQNDRYRSTMEDASKVILNYQNTPGNGYFAIFDGHAGSFTSKWCAANMNKLLSQNLTLLSQRTFASSSAPPQSIPSILALTFDQVNQKIIAHKDYDNSGSTASIAYLKTERLYPDTGLYLSTPSSSFNHQQLPRNRRRYSSFSPASPQFLVSSPTLSNNIAPPPALTDHRFQKINTSMPAPMPPNYIHTSRTRHPSTLPNARYKTISNNNNFPTNSTARTGSASTTNLTSKANLTGSGANNTMTIRKTLYTANVGDSAIVICRNGRALRVTHDHRATDPTEADRIRAAGGTIENGRVNKSLSVTRALGDQPFRPYVSARPLTAEVQLDDNDEFFVIACDGVWDVCSDQSVIDLIRDVENTDEAAREIVRHALRRGSTDNVTCMVVRLKPVAECKEQLSAVASPSLFQSSPGTASSNPISIPNSSASPGDSAATSGNTTPQEQPEPHTGSLPMHEVSFVDTIDFPAHQLHMSLPLRRDQVAVQDPSPVRHQRVASVHTVNPSVGDPRLDTLSPTDSDLTISEEDDEEESMVPGISIEEEDLEQAIADDDDEIFDMQQPSDDAGLSNITLRQPPELFRHHRSATSFTVDHQPPRFRRELLLQQQQQDHPHHHPRSTPVFELEQESKVSKLDRYGRFKRSVQLEYSYDGGDECAITDDDSD